MKKMLLASLLIFVIACGAQADVATRWGCEDTGAYLFDSSGVAIDPTGLRIELVIDQGTVTDFSEFTSGYIGLTGDANGWDIAASATTDLILDSSVWVNYGGNLGGFPTLNTAVNDSYAGATFYFRWFDASTEGAATEAGIIYGTSGWNVGAVLPAPDNPAVLLDYAQVQSSGSNNGTGWQAVAPVPEPGTIMLFALGLVTLVARRKRG